jgi:DNA helicase-2/ATP-dependent DNA helicase PcrA
LIFGPPGTGKTTECLRVVDDALANGIAPDQIMFIAFTRKAAREARERACDKFKLDSDQLPWFRTIHSLAFNQLMCNRNNIMGIRDYLVLCQQLGLSITVKGVNHEDGTFTGYTKGDRLFFMENMARSRMIDLHKYWEMSPNEDVYWYELERLRSTLIAYKQANDKKDFTDIVNEFCELDVPIPPCKLLIVDEGQDLTALQWRAVDKLSDVIDQVFVAGDDDQAIFRWAGADVEHFINLPGYRTILDQSYRVPTEVQQLADKVAGRISLRVNKVWKPRPASGSLQYESEFTNIDMSSGTWLLLARNGYLLDGFISSCITQGFVFDSATGSPLRGDVFQAIRAWEDLRKGDAITFNRVKKVYDFMSTRIGVAYGFKSRVDAMPDRETVTLKVLNEKHGLLTNKSWDDALDKMTPEERQYFTSALQRGEKFMNEPRIKISTIHSAKGGEAENVVLITDMAERTWNEFQSNPDDEHRVWYVGITRAKERLIVMSPQTNRNYEL